MALKPCSPAWSSPRDTGYVALDAGEYDLEVRLAGTDDVAIQLDPIALAGDTAYSVFAIGSAADGSLTALPVEDGSAAMVDEMAEGEEMAQESPEAAE